jgi:catechol 2,3-dioxygenase-like lactoylglutathione lyase family enzyme
MFLGLRSHIYPAPDLDAAKAWWTELLGFGPYFDEAEYVGFDVGGFELGLFPGADPADGPHTYWGVSDLEEALARLLAGGATIAEEIVEPGDQIRMAGVTTPDGFFVGLIENPHFEPKTVPGGGPGR